MADNVMQFPEQKPPEFIIGPFAENRVVIEGRLIPHLTVTREGDKTGLVIDNRLSISVPNDLAYSVCWLLANAMAVAQGYPCLSSESKDRAFAPLCTKL